MRLILRMHSGVSILNKFFENGRPWVNILITSKTTSSLRFQSPWLISKEDGRHLWCSSIAYDGMALKIETTRESEDINIRQESLSHKKCHKIYIGKAWSEKSSGRDLIRAPKLYRFKTQSSSKTKLRQWFAFDCSIIYAWKSDVCNIHSSISKFYWTVKRLSENKKCTFWDLSVIRGRH